MLHYLVIILLVFQIGSNGIISLTNSFNNHNPTALPLSGNNRNVRFITPYWADVDLRGVGEVYYRQTDNSILLARATNEIKTAFPTSQNVNVTSLFIITWDSVGYYDRHTDKV